MTEKKQFTPVRFSHLTKYSAVGAIVRDQNDWLVAIKDTSTWPSEKMQELHAVSRVKQHLKLHQRLLMPPDDKYDEEKKITLKGATLPTLRFPSWASCSNCGLLHFKPWKKSSTKLDEKILCPDCQKGWLIQVTWCAVSSHGDLIDVPWHRICHRNAKNPCEKEIGLSYLKIVGKTSAKPKVACVKCNSSNVFDSADFKLRNHNQPGIKLGECLNEKGITYTIVEVNDSSVFMPENAQALVIPPESNIDKNSLDYKLSINSQIVSEIKSSTREIQRKKLLKRAANAFGCSVSELLNAIKNLNNTLPSIDEIVVVDMAKDEYKALITMSEFPAGADFITHHLTNEWKKFGESIEDPELKTKIALVDRLVAVDRLRVIEVYKGFRRAASDFNTMDLKPDLVEPDFIGDVDWLPSIELFGEGIFFTFNIQLLQQWENHASVKKRANELLHRFSSCDLAQSLEDRVSPTARFIMLHTLSHILIRELESTAGYPASSLQERIYSNEMSDMAGILIYTAVPDIAGSLGGIVEEAQPERFIRLLSSVFSQAEWCSLDPVCSEMEGQGPSWLNRAACHGCALVPDTSCSFFNVLLDRVFIKGNEEEKIPSLLQSVRNTDGKKSI